MRRYCCSVDQTSVSNLSIYDDGHWKREFEEEWIHRNPAKLRQQSRSRCDWFVVVKSVRSSSWPRLVNSQPFWIAFVGFCGFQGLCDLLLWFDVHRIWPMVRKSWLNQCESWNNVLDVVEIFWMGSLTGPIIQSESKKASAQKRYRNNLHISISISLVSITKFYSLVVTMGQAIGLPCPVEGAKAFTNRKLSLHAYQDPLQPCLPIAALVSLTLPLPLILCISSTSWSHCGSLDLIWHQRRELVLECRIYERNRAKCTV